ncbi:MAG: TIGR00296 family protein [Methanomicrobiaceae archaeon]|nr:TIGR00296 family protein [Methanomicrobiaceae archaeon]
MVVLTEEEGRIAVILARSALEELYRGRSERCPEPLPGVFLEPRGVFVTLEEAGDLRGCIGYPSPVMPLGQALQHAAVAAATEDPRFLPVRPEELDGIDLEVTILTLPVPLTCPPDKRPSEVRVGTHGLIVASGMARGLLLPQVATAYGWDAEEFLDHTCQKAGLPPGCWRKERTEVLVFEGQVFSERDQ